MLSSEINEKRELVRQLRKQDKYEECIEVCEDSAQKIIKDGVNRRNTDDVRSFYYMSAKCYKNINKVEIAIQMIRKSLEYCIIETYIIYNYWLLAECYKEQGFYNEAIKLYDKCIEYFKSQLPLAVNSLCFENLINVISSKSFLINDIKMAEEALNTYLNKCSNDLDNDILDRLYENLFYLYKNNNYSHKARKITNEINNENLKNKLLNKIENKLFIVK